MRKLLMILLLVISCSLAAQIKFKRGWEIWCEYEQNNMEQTSDGGYIICTDAVPEMDTAANPVSWCYLVKLNQLGQTMWIKRFAKSNYTVKAFDGNSVCQTSDGGYAIATVLYTAATPSAANHTSIYIVKTDGSGNYLWSKTYPGVGNSSASCIHETADHGFIVAGKTTDTLLNVTHAYLLRTDSAGGMIWGKYYTGSMSGGSTFNSASETSDGGFIACGGQNNQTSLIVKTDPAGNVLWSNSRVSQSANHLNDVQETSNGSFIACGYDYSTIGYATLEKFSSTGTPYWSYSYNASTSGNDYSYSVVETWDGYTVSQGPLSGIGYVSLLHTDTAGQPLWAHTYNDAWGQMPIDLEHTTDGGYAMCTSWRSSLSNVFTWKMVILKTDSTGEMLCSDSVIWDTATSIQAATTTLMSASNAALLVVQNTIIYPVIMADTNFCDDHKMDITDQQPLYGVDVYPNPTSSELNVMVEGCNHDLVALHLYNSLGQEMISRKDEADDNHWRMTLPTGELADGIYFLVVEVNGVKVDSRKIIVE